MGDIMSAISGWAKVMRKKYPCIQEEKGKYYLYEVQYGYDKDALGQSRRYESKRELCQKSLILSRNHAFAKEQEKPS